MPPPTDMKSCWQAWLVTCAALKSAASRLCTTTVRPLMPPAALHHLAKAPAAWKNSTLRPGCTVLPGSEKVAMLMLFDETPRAVELPPLPEPQILPTPGHVPVVVTVLAADAGPAETPLETASEGAPTTRQSKTARQPAIFDLIVTLPP